MGRVHNELTIHAADADCRDGLLERDVGDAESSGSSVDGEDVGIDLAVCGEQDADDLSIVEVVLREEGAQRTIGHAGGQDLLLAGTAFALKVAAWELADCSGLLLVINGEGEEILAFLNRSCRDGAHEDDGLAGADDDGSVGKLGDLAGFETDRILTDIGGNSGV